MSLGKLYGVSLGPGAEDLMTIRAFNCLKTVDCIAIPRKDEETPSVAWMTAENIIGEVEGQEKLFLDFPMTKNPETLKPAWDIAFKEIRQRLMAGQDVAFITVGDAFIYSTFIYLYNHARKIWPDVEIEVIPGVSSITAVPTVAGIPVADGQQRVAIIPASYNIEDLRTIFKMFDTVILMKVSNVINQIVEALEAENLIDHAVYVAKATMDGEKIVRDLRTIKEKRCIYFSMVIVSRNDRAGILEGNETKILDEVGV